MDSHGSERVHDWLSPSGSRGTGSYSGEFDHRAALDAMTAGFGPWKALTLAQMEMVTLMSRRAQAYLAIPQRLARCRSQQDLLEEQMRFWQTSFEQYQDSTTRILQAWSDAFGGATKGFGMGFGAAPSNGAGRESSAGLIQLPLAGRKSAATSQGRPQRRPS